MEIPLGEGREILLQPLVRPQMQNLVGLYPAASCGGRHGVSSLLRPSQLLQAAAFTFRLLDLSHRNAERQSFFSWIRNSPQHNLNSRY